MMKEVILKLKVVKMYSLWFTISNKQHDDENVKTLTTKTMGERIILFDFELRFDLHSRVTANRMILL